MLSVDLNFIVSDCIPSEVLHVEDVSVSVVQLERKNRIFTNVLILKQQEVNPPQYRKTYRQGKEEKCVGTLSHKRKVSSTKNYITHSTSCRFYLTKGPLAHLHKIV